MKKIFTAAAALLALSTFGAELKIDFNAASPWKTMGNHAQNVKFEHKEFKGKKATVVTLSATAKGTDTAFSLATDSFSVKGKKSITVKFTCLGTKGMKDFKGGGRWCSAVRFSDGAKKEIAPVAAITLQPATGEYQNMTVTIPVPAKAETALLHFGFDNPNITKTNIFAITDVTVIY